jgi:hypothetical protein
MEDGKDLNSEIGMRPPAYRGLRLRPGGKWEKKKLRRRETVAGKYGVGDRSIVQRGMKPMNLASVFCLLTSVF